VSSGAAQFGRDGDTIEAIFRSPMSAFIKRNTKVETA